MDWGVAAGRRPGMTAWCRDTLESLRGLRHDPPGGPDPRHKNCREANRRRVDIAAGRGSMTTGMTRRQFNAALGWGAASIAAAEFGAAAPARAEEQFTLASTGASWG